MKDFDEIQKMKNQIKSRIKLNQKSTKDFIVFRPKINIFNPILTKKKHNMTNLTSIFQLENKRKNQVFLSTIRNHNQIHDCPTLQIQEHLQIQRCKTFKKPKNHQKNIKLIQPTKVITFRQTSSPSIKNKLFQVSNKTTRKNDRHFRKNLISQIQQKKFYDSLRLKKVIHSTIKDSQQKQNVNFSNQRIKSIPKIAPKIQKIDTSYLYNLSSNILLQNQKMEEKIFNEYIKPKQNHKRIYTEIPLFCCLSNKQRANKIKSKAQSIIDQQSTFQPWQTKQIFQKQGEQYFQL